VNKKDFVRNITIGLTDGLTIPFALAAGLSGVVESSITIAVACITLSVAGGITMSLGAYFEQKKSNADNYLIATFIIGTSYLLGGIISVTPYLFISSPLEALKYAVIITLLSLFIAGYVESQVNDANGFAGGIRVMLTGAVAALMAFYVAKLFK